MPALVNSSVGSLPGTRLEDGTMVWPRSRKNSRKARRTSAALMKGGCLGIWGLKGGLRRIDVAARIGTRVELGIAVEGSADMIGGKAPILQKSGLPRAFFPIDGQFRAELSSPRGPRERQEVGRVLALDRIVDGHAPQTGFHEVVADARRTVTAPRAIGNHVLPVALVVELVRGQQFLDDRDDGELHIATVSELAGQLTGREVPPREQGDGIGIGAVRILLLEL